MPDLTNTEIRPPFKPLPRFRIALNWISRYAAIEIAVILALAIAAYFLGRHIFDTSITSQGDVRSHVFKIELLQSYLTHFSWPQWNPYWYHGIPEDQFYPPGFYFLGALLSFIVKNGVIAYKILLLLTMMFSGLIVYFFSRRFLNLDSRIAIWCLIAYETSTPLLINFMYGEGPNLLGWSTTLAFLTVYLSQAVEGRTRSLLNILWPGFLLGVALLIHPFPVIFAGFALVSFHIIWLIYNRSWKVFIREQLPYLAGVIVVGGLIGMYYWLPAFLTLGYSSPILSLTKYQWSGGIPFLLALIFLALSVYIATRIKVRRDLKLDFIFVCFCVASALGFGATNYLPFGLGSLVQEFRFAAIVIPFFSILLIIYPLKSKQFHPNTITLSLALIVGIFLTALVFGLSRRDDFVVGFKTITSSGLGSYYKLVAAQFGPDFPNFAINIFPYFAVILFLVFSLGRKAIDIGKGKGAYILAGGACLLMLTTFVPYINTAKQVNLSNISKYTNVYTQPAYAQMMEFVKEGRLVVPTTNGGLTEGDSPVTFGWLWGVETVNGPYNQGDPKFFKITVHLEWEERWFHYIYTRENLMQESAAKYIFVRDSYSLASYLTEMPLTVSNSYGKLFTLNENVARSVKVTPVLIDVNKVREVTEFFNILLPSGYKMVLTDVHDVPPDLINNFDYVMVDDPSKVSNYQGKLVFLLNNNDNPTVTENQGFVILNLPYLTYSNQLFFHGDEADAYTWSRWETRPGSIITPDIQDGLDKSKQLLSPYFDKLEYTKVNYELTDTKIELGNTPGFTLVKDSYFPYWKTNSGKIMSTSQGFMLTYSDSSNIILNYKKPLYYIFAPICSVLSLIAVITMLLLLKFRKRAQKV